MKIIIVGIGKVGYAIAEQMTGENHDLVVIDRNSAVLDHVDSMLDVMCVEGNGASASVLLEAGVREADLLIAVSENDEVNLICCLMAKKLGAGDRVYVIGTPAETTRVLRSMGRAMAPIRRVSILGGSRIAQYLAWVLTDIGTHVTIVEKDEAKCLTLAEKLPKVTVIHGDGTNHDLLESEGIFHCDAFIAVTDRDEENLLMALTAKRYGVKKVVPKMSRMGYLDIVNLTGLDTVISPKAIIASQISSYVRGLANSQGSAVESLHYILGGAIEAVEFTATSATHFLDRPLSDLHFRNGLLVAAIVHNGRMEIPNGHSQIHAGDRVIVVAKKLFLQDLNDILG